MIDEEAVEAVIAQLEAEGLAKAASLGLPPGRMVAGELAE